MAAHPDANLEVYVVWEPMLGGRRDHALEATALMPDPRVHHFWNDQFIVGNHFREAAFGRTAWDIYFLYGSEAEWAAMPGPQISSGFTIYSRRDQLLTDFTALLELDER